MIYTKEPGIIYDCIYYGILYFDKNAYESEAETCLPWILKDIDNEYCYYLDGLKIFPSKDIGAFFYHDVIPSALSELLRNNLCSKNCYKKFMSLLSDKVSLREFVLSHILSESEVDFVYDETDPNVYTNLYMALNASGYNRSTADLFLTLFMNFDKNANLLISYFNEIYPVMTQMHRANKREINACLASIKSGKTMDYFCNNDIVNISQSEYINTLTSICLINPRIYLHNRAANLLMFGIKYHENASAYFKIKNKTIQSFNSAMSSKIRYKIVTLIKDAGGSMSEDAILKRLNISPSSAEKHFKILSDELILTHDRYGLDGNTYYININYFKYLYPEITKFFSSVILLGELFDKNLLN